MIDNIRRRMSMAFDSLSDKLQNVFKKLRSKGVLTEDDVKEAMKEVKEHFLRPTLTSKLSSHLSSR